MKPRFLKTVLLAAVIVSGIWLLFNRDKIRAPGDVVHLIKQKLDATPIGFRLDGVGSNQIQSNAPPASSPNGKKNDGLEAQFVTNVVRIASFKLNQQIPGSPSNQAIDLLADICRRYDAIALQQVSGNNTTWLTRLTERMNTMGAVGSMNSPALDASGKKADYCFVSDRKYNAGHSTQAVIVFNQRTLELDQRWYTVNDPDDLLSREPLVAWFRTRGPAPDQAFTFTLVNLKIDSQRPEQELACLGELYRAIRDDGRGEDDVLIVGDFNAGDQGLRPVRKRAGLTWVVSNRPTSTRNQGQFDNLVFNQVATVEFTGRGGVFDFMRHYNLRLNDAIRISDHLPVWAEFSIFESAGQTPANQERRVAVGAARFKPR